MFVAFAKLQPLPPAALQRFLDLLEMQLQKYVLSLYAECPPLPESALQSGVNAAAAPATPPPAEKLPPGTPFAVRLLNQRKNSRTSTASNEGSAADSGPRPVARDAALDAQPIGELCQRLNNAEWVGNQTLTLADRLRDQLPGLAALPSAKSGLLVAVSNLCDRTCLDLINYISAKVVFYELDAHLLTKLYAPAADADGARLAPLLRSSPLAPAQAGRAVPGRWQQKMLLGLLGSFAAAYAAVLELPARSYRSGDLPLLREDVGLLCRYFLDGGVLEEPLVRQSLGFLNALAEQACER